MTAAWTAALVALFAWWFSTGIILLAVRLADRTGPGAHRQCALLTLPVLALGLAGFRESLPMDGAEGAYLGFLAALAIWGWVELAFLTGVLTGPNTRPCPPGRPEWERFIRAWGTIAWHEMALVALTIGLGLAAWEAPNPTGFYCFAVLFFARVSAKLNLFFGVPRINVAFLPRPLAHLPSHFRIARRNRLYPVSVTALSLATGCWLERLWWAEAPGEVVGYALLATLTGLALLEHWFMVLPLPDERLWRWMLPAPVPAPAPRQPPLRPTEDAHGL
ncbi:MAG: DUF3623 family protein [Rhodobacteraceae bacterium]|jgi:putative photosynthetic complex assembly protein 2|nr:DUF3623 family protein [Paracoccaceae bacterium]